MAIIAGLRDEKLSYNSVKKIMFSNGCLSGILDRLSAMSQDFGSAQLSEPGFGPSSVL